MYAPLKAENEKGIPSKNVDSKGQVEEKKEEPLEKKEKPERDSRGEEKKGKQRTARFLLCNGLSVHGKLAEPIKAITFHHKKNSIDYLKSLQFEEVQKIEILKWEKVFQKNISSGQLYQMNPYDFQITTLEGDIFIVNGLQNLPFLRFQVKNRNGTTSVFSYWTDLLQINGSWYSGLGEFQGNYRTDCHPGVLKSVEFYK